MANNIKISLLGFQNPEPPRDYRTGDLERYKTEIKRFLHNNIAKVLPDSPNLIIFPECANRFLYYKGQNLSEYFEERINFYRYAEDFFVDYMKEIARNNNTNIAYSAVRPIYGTDSFANSVIYINRKGEIDGIYDKYHPMEKENTDHKIIYGTNTDLIETDFGRVATAICFDLNFDDLLYTYKEQNPDLIVFSSAYNGGFRQEQWAYTCRSYFAGCVQDGPSRILNPYGKVIATTTNYTNFVTANVNLDYELCHIDYNWDKFKKAKEKYKDKLTVYDPGYVGSVMLTCEAEEMTVQDIIKEFEITTLDEYIESAMKHRKENVIL